VHMSLFVLRTDFWVIYWPETSDLGDGMREAWVIARIAMSVK
jgi:hypothetical protein